MTVASIRAQFGITPAGDPYDPITYAVVSQRNNPSTDLARYRILNPSAYVVFLNLYPGKAKSAMQNRFIPDSTGSVGNCPANLGGFAPTGSPLGPPFAVAAGIGPLLGPVGTGVGSLLAIVGQLVCTNSPAQEANFNQVLCQVSATLSKLISIFDIAVAQGKITADQAASLWQQYTSQLLPALGHAVAQCNTLTPQTAFLTIAIIKSVGDFSQNYFWPDIYPKPIVVAPASPTISTPTSAPASQFAATPATPPAAIVPSIIAPPNSLPGSPSLGAPIVRGVVSGAINYGTTQKNANNFQVPGIPPAQALPQGVGTSVVYGGSLIVPALIVAGVIAAAVLL